jgi:outer membrane protein
MVSPRSCVVGALVLLMCGLAHGRSRPRGVAVVLDGPSPINARVLPLLQREITALASGGGPVDFGAGPIVADWTNAGVDAALDRAFADKSVGVVLAMGVLSSNALANKARSKPAVAGLVLDSEMQGFPRAGIGSGVRDLTYLARGLDVARDLDVFADVVKFKRLAVLGNVHFLNSVPSMLPRIVSALAKRQEDIEVVAVGADLQDALGRIPETADAVYVAPLLHLSAEEFALLVQTLNERKLPTFSALGRSEVEAGFLVGRRPASDISRLARRVALGVQQALLGESLAHLPVDFERGEQLVLNMATARAIGASPSWRILTEAELLKSERAPSEHPTTLQDAVATALAGNHRLRAANAQLEASREDRSKARALLLPTVEVGAQAAMVDEDRAAASSGQQPQYTGTVKATFTQLVWADGAWANLSIQERLQKRRSAERDGVRLDVVLDTATAYYTVLTAVTFERIQRENLRRTRKNLALARVRAKVGSGRVAEVYRWEAQIASDQQSVIDANSQRNLAELQFNRVLGRPLEASCELADARLDDPTLISANEQVFALLDNPWAFKRFRAFMVQEGLGNAPELQGLNAALEALDRRVVAGERSLWAPTVGLQAEISHRFVAEGEGTEGLTLPLPAGSDQPPSADDTNWFVGLNATLPLYEGGERYAEIRQAKAERASLLRQKAQVSQQLEQRIRAAVHRAGGAFPRIRLSGLSAEAARKSLDLVSEAYARGAVSAVELVDAQNAAHVAEEAAAIAVYDFLAELMQVHRSVGGFYFLETPEARAAWTQRLKQFIAEDAAQP